MSSNITSYQKNGVFYYQKSQVNGASGTSGSSGASETSGASEVSGTYVIDVRVENLTIHEVIDLFKQGNLTTTEFEKWLNKNAKEFSKTEDDNSITYKFKYYNQEYSVSCSKEAAESQTDNITQQTYSLADLLNKGIPRDKITTYFDTASSVNSHTTSYKLKDGIGFDSVEDLTLFLNKDKNLETLINKFNNFDKIINDIQQYIGKINNGDTSVLDKLKNSFNSLKYQYTGIENIAEKYKLKDSEEYSDLINKYDNQISDIEESLANCIVNGMIENAEIGKIGASIGKNSNNTDLQDLLNRFFEYIQNYTNEHGKITQDQFAHLFEFYTSQNGTVYNKDVIQNAMNEMYSKYKESGLDTTKIKDYANNIEESNKLSAEKEKLINKLDYYISLVDKYIKNNDKYSLMNLLPKIADLATSLLGFIKTIDAYEANNTFYGKDKISDELMDKYKELWNSLNNSDDFQNMIDSVDDLDAISKTMDEITKTNSTIKMRFGDIQERINQLFENKETVTLEELLSIFNNTDYDTAENFNLNDLIDLLEEIDAQNEASSPQGKSSRRRSIAASQLRLLLLALQGQQNNDETNVIINKTELEQLCNDIGVDYASMLEELYNYQDNYVQNEELQNIAENFGLNYSDIKISVNEIKSALAKIFAGREDITKDEVKAAIRSIFIQKCFDEAFQNMQEEYINSQQSFYDNDMNDMNSEISAISDIISSAISDNYSIFSDDITTNTNLEAAMDLIGVYKSVLRCLSDIMQALANGDFSNAENKINELTNLLNTLLMFYKNNNDTTAVNKNNNSSDFNDIVNNMTSTVNRAKARRS